MSKLWLLAFFPLLTGCETARAFVEGSKGSVTDENLPTMVSGGVDDVSNSNWVGAAYGVGALISLALLKKAGSHVIKRMTDSEPGQIV